MDPSTEKAEDPHLEMEDLSQPAIKRKHSEEEDVNVKRRATDDDVNGKCSVTEGENVNGTCSTPEEDVNVKRRATEDDENGNCNANLVVKRSRATEEEDINGICKATLEDDVNVKRSRVTEEEDAKHNGASLTSLADDVLLIILSYVDHFTLLQLQSTCSLFGRLCQDYTLWRKVDFLEYPVSSVGMKYLAKNVHKETKSIRAVGNCQYTLKRGWFETVSEKCTNLESLAIPCHFINCKYTTITNFPNTITELNLSFTRLRNLPEGRSYFKDISLIIPNLRVLNLTRCPWFEPHSLMALSKCSKLEELYLTGCVKVKDCLAYFGISTRGGFQSLKTLDLSRCLISASELVCLSSVPTLKNLYLEDYVNEGTFIDPAIVIMCTHHRRQREGDGVIEIERQRVLIEELAIRNYRNLTDGTLLKLAEDAHALTYLDVRGSGVSKEAVEKFKAMRPQVKLVAD